MVHRSVGISTSLHPWRFNRLSWVLVHNHFLLHAFSNDFNTTHSISNSEPFPKLIQYVFHICCTPANDTRRYVHWSFSLFRLYLWSPHVRSRLVCRSWWPPGLRRPDTGTVSFNLAPATDVFLLPYFSVTVRRTHVLWLPWHQPKELLRFFEWFGLVV
jgi:hypothetical protein